MLTSYIECGKPVDRVGETKTCRRRAGHNTVCSPIRDRGSERFDDAWAEHFAANPDVLASWGHQNGRMPPGYGELDG